MECSCISIDDTDGYSVSISDSWHTAKKEHKCGECHRVIIPGERYRCETIKVNGKLSTHKTCNDCESLKKAFFCDYIFGEVWEDFQDSFDYCFEGISWSKLATLTPAAQHRVFKMIEGCWEEDEDDGDE